MIVTYTPEGGESRTWDYKPDQLLAAEAEAIEDATRLTFDEINHAILKGSVKARRAVLWVLLKRDQPTLRFANVSFRAGEVTVEFDHDEKVAWRKAITSSKQLTDEEREMALLALDGELFEDIAEATEAEAPKGEVLPEPSPSES